MVPNSIALAIRTRSGLLSQKTSSDYQTACGSSENAPMGCTELDGGRKATLCGGGEPANWPSASALTDGMSVKACFTGSFPHNAHCLGVFVKLPQNRHPEIDFFCPSNLTAPNKSHHPPLVIPSAAEGPAVRPGSRTKVSGPLVLPQNRHPQDDDSCGSLTKTPETSWQLWGNAPKPAFQTGGVRQMI